jgi:hypothetical protein
VRPIPHEHLPLKPSVGLTCETACEVVRYLSKNGVSLMDSFQAMLLVVMGTTAVLSFASMPWRLSRGLTVSEGAAATSPARPRSVRSTADLPRPFRGAGRRGRRVRLRGYPQSDASTLSPRQSVEFPTNVAPGSIVVLVARHTNAHRLSGTWVEYGDRHCAGPPPRRTCTEAISPDRIPIPPANCMLRPFLAEMCVPDATAK